MVSPEHQRIAFRTPRLALRGIVEDDFGTISQMEHPDDADDTTLEKTATLHRKLLVNNHLHLLIYLLPANRHLPRSGSQSALPSISWEDASAGIPIGNAGMMSNYELGYLIAPQHRRNGYASEAVAGILGHVWRMADRGALGALPRDDNTGKVYVSASVEPVNISSIRVLEKVGGVEEPPQKSEPLYSASTTDDTEKKPLKKFRMYQSAL